ncbi:MAG TPA: deoxyribonuclease IV [Gemmatimonadales bacterium]|nr:deoxyribonuclease IV [Gemmatimonadales bacterium]
MLGAHVSSQGGVQAAPRRGGLLRATAIQLFTKTPNQWRERAISTEAVARFKSEVVRHKLEAVVAHDSYLINLASPDPVLHARSMESFCAELERSSALGLRAVVSHPGNYIDDRDAGLERNASGYAACLARVPSGLEVWIEGTAGSGTALGARFEELRDLRNALPDEIRTRVGFCLDTAHLHAVGYDLARIEDVWDEFDRVVGLGLLKCLHLNDSRADRGSRVDRHEWIAEGRIGPEPFRRIMRDSDLEQVVKIIETPKREDPLRHDRRMLRRLRAYARRGNAVVAAGV